MINFKRQRQMMHGSKIRILLKLLVAMVYYTSPTAEAEMIVTSK